MDQNEFLDKVHQEFVESVQALKIDTEQMKKIAAELEQLAPGRVHVRRIIALLQEGNLEGAVWLSQQEADKNTPGLTAYFLSVFGCRLHARRNCQAPFC